MALLTISLGLGLKKPDPILQFTNPTECTWRKNQGEVDLVSGPKGTILGSYA